MDNINNTQIVLEKGYQTLGKKVFWLFFLQAAPAGFVLFIISIILFILSFQSFLTDTFLGDIQTGVLLATFIMFILSLVAIAISLFIARLTYQNYVFSLEDDSFKIKRGILNKTENAIPYHQIQNVDIERDFMFQMLGLSRLIILTAGHEDQTPKAGEAEGMIPAIDEKLAGLLQTELLKRAGIQRVIETK